MSLIAAQTARTAPRRAAAPHSREARAVGNRSVHATNRRPTPIEIPIPDIDDVRSVAMAVLRHRLVVNFQAEADNVPVEKIIEVP